MALEWDLSRVVGAGYLDYYGRLLVDSVFLVVGRVFLGYAFGRPDVLRCRNGDVVRFFSYRVVSVGSVGEGRPSVGLVRARGWIGGHYLAHADQSRGDGFLADLDVDQRVVGGDFVEAVAGRGVIGVGVSFGFFGLFGFVIFIFCFFLVGGFGSASRDDVD